ncbi:MAG: DUF4038 domain-containing protein [Chloroflexi bacterium]|nr:DUF4038 domain-containing protein [Chloroflexota bacterium]
MTDRIHDAVPRWWCFEHQFASEKVYANPFQDIRLTVTFTSPSGQQRAVDGFWDGGMIWRVRFAPDETGAWSYQTTCSDAGNHGLHGQSGRFSCGQPSGSTRFQQHGGVRLSDNRRYLVHTDGTPFLWLGDTAWNGPLRSTPDEWALYLHERVRQKFSVVQWVDTQWLASPQGDLNGDLAYTELDRIAVNPAFFQRLDERVAAMIQVGLLSVPVMLWAAEWRSPEENQVDPGYSLPEDQAILLGRYLVARWSAYPVVWILPGDGDYRGEKAARWQRIGRGIFGDQPHAPVSLHPGGMQWNGDEFRHEDWLDILGYQSGHGDDENTLDWLVCGPPATDWKQPPARVLINLEPPYENHISYQSKQRISADMTRRALYWSLLVAPTAGVTYGGHGIWGWDDGTTPPAAHPNTGIPLPWQQALLMPGAEQVRHISELFESIQWWRLLPAPELLVNQPGDEAKRRFIAVSKSTEDDLIVAYIPEDREFRLKLDGLTDDLSAVWFDPRSGGRQAASLDGGHFTTPAPGDWVLLLGRTLSLPSAQGEQP